MKPSLNLILTILISCPLTTSLAYAESQEESLSPIVLSTENNDASPHVAQGQTGHVVTMYYYGPLSQVSSAVAAPAVVLQPISNSPGNQIAPCTTTSLPPAYMPTSLDGPPSNAGLYRPIVALRPMPTGYYVGRGIIGQPKLYVPGQPIRNFVRWLTP